MAFAELANVRAYSVRIVLRNEQRSLFRRGAPRWGSTLTLTLVALFVMACLVIAGRFFAGRHDNDDIPELLTTTVWKGPYDFAVTSRGTVESASNTELRCEVRSRGGGTVILDVVPEGTVVN